MMDVKTCSSWPRAHVVVLSFATLLLIGGAAAHAGLRLHWPIEEGSGTNVAELVTGSNDVAHLSVSTAWVPGIAPGSTWAFQSDVGQYINAGTLLTTGDYVPGDVAVDRVNLGDNWTVTAWLKRDNTLNRTFISSKWNTPAFDFKTANADGDLQIYYNNNSQYATTDLTMPPNTTNLVAIQYDRNMTSGNLSAGMRLRVLIWNGTSWQVEESVAASRSPASLEDVTIGCFSSGRGRNFVGVIDDVRIYDATENMAVLCALAGDTSSPTPSNLSAASTGGDSILLDWDDNTEPDFSSYNVYRSTSSGIGYALVASNLTASTFGDTGLTTGTPYYYVVTALDAIDNESGLSDEATATPVVDTTPPAAPTGLSAMGVSSSAVVLDWDDNSETDFSSYSVYRSTSSGGGYVLVASNLTASAYGDSGLNAETPYYYVVTAWDFADNESSDSGEGAAMTLAAPTDPDLLLWWKLDEGVGTVTAEQVSGQPNTATLEGPLTWTTGIAPDGGNAILFADTTPDSWVEAGTLLADGSYVPGSVTGPMLLDSSWTMTAWVKLTDPQGSTSLRSILSVNWSNSNGDWMWQLTGSDNHFSSESRPGGTYVSTLALDPGQVYLVVWQADATGLVLEPGVASRYKVWDGAAWQENTFGTRTSIDMQRLQIGQFPGREFRGIIDDVRIYTRTLSDAELDALAGAKPSKMGVLIYAK